MRFKILILLLVPTLGWAQLEPAKKSTESAEDHQPSIHGIRIGMTTEQVLDRLGGRVPDARKDEKGEIIVFWKLEGGNILQVNFRKENYVSHVALQFHPPRPTNDFWLMKLKDSAHQESISSTRPGALDPAAGSSAPGTLPSGPGAIIRMEDRDKAPELSSTGTGASAITARDPRWRVDYRISETEDRERTVWVRELDAEDGFRIEVRFLSAHKKRLGDRYESEVEFKYVSVNRNDLKKFDEAMTGKK